MQKKYLKYLKEHPNNVYGSAITSPAMALAKRDLVPLSYTDVVGADKLSVRSDFTALHNHLVAKGWEPVSSNQNAKNTSSLTKEQSVLAKEKNTIVLKEDTAIRTYVEKGIHKIGAAQ